MFFDAQDVVGESCASQLEAESPVLMASVHATRNLPRPAGAGGPTSSSWRLLGAVRGTDTHDGPTQGRSKQRPSAAAMVLARKRRRDEQRRKLDAVNNNNSSSNNTAKKQCVGGGFADGSPSDDDYDVEEQLTAFVEYNATDMDGLDINPSQDFDGDMHGRTSHDNRDGSESLDAVTQASQLLQTCGWEHLTDAAQDHEEASEVFDNVIYAPQPALRSSPRKTTSFRPLTGRTVPLKPSPFPPKHIVTAELDKSVSAPVSEDSEGSLSDGFEVMPGLKTTIGCAARPSVTKPSKAEAPKTPQQHLQWRQRRSVKRDCSFVDSGANSSDVRLLPPSSSSNAAPLEASSIKVIELKNGSFDSSDDELEAPMQPSEAASAPPGPAPATVDTMTVVSSSSSTIVGGGLCPMGFQPRLVRKRRKVEQLTLDGFFSAPQSWS